MSEQRKIRVAVVFGGRSAEHAVSCASAGLVLGAIDRDRYEVVPVGIARDGRWVLTSGDPARLALGSGELPSVDAVATPGVSVTPRTGAGSGALVITGPAEIPAGLGDVDVVLPLLHGTYGEDGTIQGLLELANKPYVGAGVLASAVGMDKAVMKTLFAARGLPVCPYRVLRRHEWNAAGTTIAAELEKALKYPMFVKPANLGSSVGISKAKDAIGLREAIALAGSFDRKIVVEAAVPDAREIECAVLGNDEPDASVAGEVIPSREFYDYEAKYIDAGSKTVIPADLPKKIADKVRQMSIDAFKAIDGAGMSRVDFLLSGKDHALFVNEVNTIPGFTTISMFAKLWAASGVDYPTLLDRLIALAIQRHSEKQQLRTSVT
jgi:D-alanine-D-alanine ligase